MVVAARMESIIESHRLTIATKKQIKKKLAKTTQYFIHFLYWSHQLDPTLHISIELLYIPILIISKDWLFQFVIIHLLVRLKEKKITSQISQNNIWKKNFFWICQTWTKLYRLHCAGNDQFQMMWCWVYTHANPL